MARFGLIVLLFLVNAQPKPGFVAVLKKVNGRLVQLAASDELMTSLGQVLETDLIDARLGQRSVNCPDAGTATSGRSRLPESRAVNAFFTSHRYRKVGPSYVCQVHEV